MDRTVFCVEYENVAKENKFKVGDRVVMVHPEKSNAVGVKAGNKGRVLAVDGHKHERLDILVDWNNPVLECCHNWWVSHESLELENAGKENKFKVGDRVVMTHPEIANTDGVKAGNKGRVLAFDSGNNLDIFVDWDEPVLSDANRTNYGCKLGHGWWVSHASLELENVDKKSKPTHVIVMKYDGTTTTAFEKVNNKIVAKAEARRHPDDFASSSIGFKLAFERLMDEVVKEDENEKKTPKAKFAIDDIHEGDFVTIKNDLIADEWYGSHMAVSEMLPYRANTVRVSNVYLEDKSFSFRTHGFRFTPEMIDNVYHYESGALTNSVEMPLANKLTNNDKSIEDLKNAKKCERHDLSSDPQVGDLVKIRSDLKANEMYGDMHFFSGMYFPHFIQVVERDGNHIRCENEFWYDISMIEKVFPERKSGDKS